MRARIGFVVAFALILRSLLAPGFMLELGERGSFSVVICTEHGALSVVLDEDGIPLEKKQDKGSSLSCPFAASSIVALLGAPIVVQAITTRIASSAPALAGSRLATRHELPGPARGPPVA